MSVNKALLLNSTDDTAMMKTSSSSFSAISEVGCFHKLCPCKNNTVYFQQH